MVRKTISAGSSRPNRLPSQGLALRCPDRIALLRAPDRKPCLFAAALAEPVRLFTRLAASVFLSAANGRGPILLGAMSLAM